MHQGAITASISNDVCEHFEVNLGEKLSADLLTCTHAPFHIDPQPPTARKAPRLRSWREFRLKYGKNPNQSQRARRKSHRVVMQTLSNPQKNAIKARATKKLSTKISASPSLIELSGAARKLGENNFPFVKICHFICVAKILQAP
jgi:hypothetical protein